MEGNFLRILTFNEIKNYEKQILLSESSERFLKRYESSEYKNVFLSHSSEDIDKIPGIIKFLEQFGASVYIDKIDKELPKITNRETAEILKNRIITISKFIVFVTPNSKESKWIPWELGLADGMKDTKNIAILPAAQYESETQWTEMEYLGIYPKIMNYNGNWVVYYPYNNEVIYLRNWLKT